MFIILFVNQFKYIASLAKLEDNIHFANNEKLDIVLLVLNKKC